MIHIYDKRFSCFMVLHVCQLKNYRKICFPLFEMIYVLNVEQEAAYASTTGCIKGKRSTAVTDRDGNYRQDG